jgi:hypothetical protein
LKVVFVAFIRRNSIYILSYSVVCKNIHRRGHS